MVIKARQGKARQGKARQGKARQGKARQGKPKVLQAEYSDKQPEPEVGLAIETYPAAHAPCTLIENHVAGTKATLDEDVSDVQGRWPCSKARTHTIVTPTHVTVDARASRSHGNATNATMTKQGTPHLLQ